LTVPAHIGKNFDAVGAMHQDATFPFMRKSEIVTALGHHELVAYITRTLLEDL
jgi:hypothetical protein